MKWTKYTKNDQVWLELIGCAEWAVEKISLCMSLFLCFYPKNLRSWSTNWLISKGFKDCLCSPLFGERMHFDYNMFHMSWNHQIDYDIFMIVHVPGCVVVPSPAWLSVGPLWWSEEAGFGSASASGWANYNNLSRGHHKWWFSRGILPEVALALEITVLCADSGVFRRKTAL